MVRLSAPPSSSTSPAWLRVAQAVGLPLLVLVGLVLLVGSRTEPYLGPFGLLMLGLGLVGVVQLLLQRRWERERPGPTLSRDPRGTPSTLLARAPWSAALRWGITAALAVPLALWALLALLDRQWFWVAVLLAALAYVVVKIAPRGAAKGIHLTPEHLVVDDHGRERVVPWSQVRDVVPVNRTHLRLQDGSTVHFVAADLSVDPYLACLALQVCVNGPDVRPQLGTPASLDWPVWGDAR